MYLSTLMKALKAAVLTLGVSALSGLPTGVRAAEISVFAAASLKTAMDDITATFAEATEHRAVVSMAGSSALARQIELGAPADVFLSANVAWMQYLAANGHIQPQTRVDLLGNKLVLIAPRDDAQVFEFADDVDFGAALGSRRLAMALVDAVPAGIYGKAALTNMGLWEVARPRVVQMDNVRAAMALVALGEAGFGIVYATDAMAEPRVKIVAEFAQGSHPPIIYPVAAVSGRDNPVAGAFLTFLQGPQARDIFERHGFDVLEPM